MGCPSDAAAVKANPKLRLLAAPGIAYQALLINTRNGPRSDTPLGRDPRVREAFEKSIDRIVLNQIVSEGQFVPNNQVEAPGTPYWNAARAFPARDVPGAKALLKAAGVDRVSFELTIANSPVAVQTGELLQSMAAEVGFDIKLRAMESNAALAAEQAGDYQMATGIWSGRADPDGNIAIWLASDGFLNWGKYSNPKLDDLLVRARGVTAVADRQTLYRQISEIYLDERPMIVMYHQNWLFGISEKLTGFTPVPDGLIRPQGLVLR